MKCIYVNIVLKKRPERLEFLFDYFKSVRLFSIDSRQKEDMENNESVPVNLSILTRFFLVFKKFIIMISLMNQLDSKCLQKKLKHLEIGAGCLVENSGEKKKCLVDDAVFFLRKLFFRKC